METRPSHVRSFQSSFEADRRFASPRAQQHLQSGASSLESPSSPDSLAPQLRRHSGDIQSGTMTAYLHEIPVNAFVGSFINLISLDNYFLCKLNLAARISHLLVE